MCIYYFFLGDDRGKQMSLKQMWDLEVFFPGGANSKEAHACLEKISSQIKQATDASLLKTLQLSQEISFSLREIESFACCHQASDVKNTAAISLQDKIAKLQSSYETLLKKTDKQLAALSNDDFNALTISLPDCAFYLKERRNLAKEQLSPKEEKIIDMLSISGYQANTNLFATLIGEMEIPFGSKKLSFSQVENKLSDGDASIRNKAFISLQKAFREKENLFAQILNNIAGFRLQRDALYPKEILHEPLQINRLEEQTLNSMWEAVTKIKKPLIKYLEKRASMLGKSKLSWQDLEAPLFSHQKKISYEDASAQIIELFTKTSPQMGAYAKNVLHDRWIDAEDRSSKSPGGFCTYFPHKKQSRIFMTYCGTQTNVSTLAHELGHGFHNEAMKDLPAFAQVVPMTLAETASTFAELLISEGSIENASSKEEKLTLLDDQIMRSVAFCMNLHARYIFELNFYEERKKGFVSAEILSTLMEEAQKKAYCNTLEEYHPLFWAAKMHFYLTDVPFYNFSYTFGFLFSSGMYQFGKESTNFEEKYIALLRDTGSATVENLARKHLGVDLSQTKFWEDAFKPIEKQIDLFFSLIDK